MLCWRQVINFHIHPLARGRRWVDLPCWLSTQTYILYSITYLWLITYYKRHSNYLYWKNRPSQIHSSLSFYEGSIKLSEWRSPTIDWGLSIGHARKSDFWIQTINLNNPLIVWQVHEIRIPFKSWTGCKMEWPKWNSNFWAEFQKLTCWFGSSTAAADGALEECE